MYCAIWFYYKIETDNNVKSRAISVRFYCEPINSNTGNRTLLEEDTKVKIECITEHLNLAASYRKGFTTSKHTVEIYWKGSRHRRMRKSTRINTTYNNHKCILYWLVKLKPVGCGGEKINLVWKWSTISRKKMG